MSKKDLAATHPQLVEEWSAQNILSPAQVSKGSVKRVWWRCVYGHEYQAQVYSRVAGSGCPYCAGKKPIVGQTDLASTHPALLKEWDYLQNELDPTDVTAGSHKGIWWRCPKGHCYRSAPYTRIAGSGCPYCANRRVLPGFNDLATTDPGILKEWDAELNGELTPRMITRGSPRKVWWRCQFGHEWRAAVYSRTRERACGCPYCNGRYKLPKMHALFRDPEQ